MTDLEHVRIRLITPQDLPLVEAFYDQMGGESRAFFNRGDGNRQFSLRALRGEAPNTAFFLAEAEGRMVGTVFLWDTHKRVPWLGIAVAEDCKGRHLGRSLLSHAHEHARALGAGGVLLTTAVANIRGQGLYERMGYERLGQHSSGEYLYLLRFDVGAPGAQG